MLLTVNSNLLCFQDYNYFIFISFIHLVIYLFVLYLVVAENGLKAIHLNNIIYHLLFFLFFLV